MKSDLPDKANNGMAVLPILEFPDPRLRIRAVPVEFDHIASADFQQLLDDMLETMYAAPGVGLAATQVNVHRRFMVIDVSEEHDTPQVFINPKIIERHCERVHQEGCLSVPGMFADISRADRITVQFFDRLGEEQTLEADGLLSTCIQHEMDHLEGKLFIDYLSPIKRTMIRRKLEKQRKNAA